MAHTERKELLISWLRNAYSMEKALENVLDNQAKRASDFPEVQSRLRGHAEQTRRQGALVKGRIEALGANVSKLKSGFAQLFGEVQSQSMGSSPEAVVRDAIMNHAAENFEIASYRAIIQLAEDINDQETVRMAKEILREEEEMAEWVKNQLPKIVDQVSQGFTV